MLSLFLYQLLLPLYIVLDFINGWIILSSFGVLSIGTFIVICQFISYNNISIDYITLGFFLWNWCILGIVCEHYMGPLLLQNFYKIAKCVILALLLVRFFPNLAVWLLLILLPIWDLIAVLCPNGPLRILFETAQSRNEPIFPSLIYSLDAPMVETKNDDIEEQCEENEYSNENGLF